MSARQTLVNGTLDYWNPDDSAEATTDELYDLAAAAEQDGQFIHAAKLHEKADRQRERDHRHAQPSTNVRSSTMNDRMLAMDDERIEREIAFAEGFDTDHGSPEEDKWLRMLREETTERKRRHEEENAPDR